MYFSIFSALHGCTTSKIEEAKEQSNFVENAISAKGAVMGKSENPSTVTQNNVYFGSRKSKVETKPNLPKQVDLPIVIGAGSAMTLSELSELIYLSTGLSMYYTPDALSSLSGQSANTNSGVIAAADSSGSGNVSSTTTSDDLLSKYTVHLIHEGTLKNLLDTFTSRTNLFWEWDGKRLKVFRQKSKTFAIKAFAGKYSLTTTTTASVTSSGSGVDSSNSQTATTNSSEQDVWAEMQSDLRAMMSPDGRWSVSDAIGMITVTDTPFVLANITDYIEEQNRQLTKQIRIRVEIYEVESANNDEVGIDWSFLNTTSNYSLSFLSNSFPAATNPNVTYGVIDPNSNLSGSEAFLLSMRTKNRVSQVTTEDIITLNSQSIPVRVERQQGYLESAKTSFNDFTTSTELIPGTITSGISMMLLPKVVNQREIMLHFNLNISNLDALLSFSSNDTTIQLPTVSVKNFMQRIMMRSGNTVVITGFEANRNNDDYNGVLEQSFSIAGGRSTGGKKRSSTLILITPVVLEV